MKKLLASLILSSAALGAQAGETVVLAYMGNTTGGKIELTAAPWGYGAEQNTNNACTSRDLIAKAFTGQGDTWYGCWRADDQDNTVTVRWVSPNGTVVRTYSQAAFAMTQYGQQMANTK